jgi:hypothetical protein
MSFKDDVANDIHETFLNEQEFAEIHRVSGKELLASVDDMELVNRQKKSGSLVDGIHRKRIMLYVAGSEFGPLPAAESLLALDGKRYRVVEAHDEDGMYSITLEVARA